MRLALSLLTLSVLSAPLHATIYTMNYSCISNSTCAAAVNGPGTQLTTLVVGDQSYDDGAGGLANIAVSNNQALFVFKNNIVGASIHEIYFDDTNLLDVPPSLYEMSGVDYQTTNVNPGNLPGGNNVNPDFQVTAGAALDTQGNQQNGVNNSTESLGVLFNLKAGKTYADVIAALVSGALRIGLHVGDADGNGGSLAFVNGGPQCVGTNCGPPPPPPPPNSIPEPSSMALLGTMFAGVGLLLRRRSK